MKGWRAINVRQWRRGKWRIWQRQTTEITGYDIGGPDFELTDQNAGLDIETPGMDNDRPQYIKDP